MTKRRQKRSGESRRVPGPFVALPHAVLCSPSYRELSYSERALLVDIALQNTGKNNGKLVACMKYLSAHGWNSHDTVYKGVKSLVERGLLIETRKGARPNRAAWFAVAWESLDVTVGLDIDPAHYRRGCTYSLAPLVPKSGIEK